MNREPIDCGAVSQCEARRLKVFSRTLPYWADPDRWCEWQVWGDTVEKVAAERINARFTQSCFKHGGESGMLFRNISPSRQRISREFC
jgi:hypothetical protein